MVLSDKILIVIKQAGVAKLADALRSGRSEITLMWVQIPPSAQEDPFTDLFLLTTLFLYSCKFHNNIKKDVAMIMPQF